MEGGVMARKAKSVEIGRTGLPVWSGQIDDEFLRALKGQQGRRVYREMADNDPIVGACLQTIKQTLRSVEVRCEAETPDTDSVAAAEFVQSCLDGMEYTWQDTLSDALSMLTYGWCAQEIVYQRRDDGRIGWRKMAPRAQESLDAWEFDDHGDVTGLWQQPPTGGGRVLIPADKLMLFRTEWYRGNPEGRSILRSAYVPYYHCKHIRWIEGVGIERDLTGYPVLRAPSQVANENATGDAATAYTRLKDIGRNIRRDEQECLILPSDRDPQSGQFMYDLQLVTTGGSRQIDTNAVIGRLQKEIALAMLSDFVLLGHEKVGSFSLADSKTSTFALAISGWLDSILAVWNRYAIRRLLAVNGMAGTACMKRGDIESPDLDKLGAFVAQMSTAGYSGHLTPEVETALLDAAHLPTSGVEDMAEAMDRIEHEPVEDAAVADAPAGEDRSV